MQRLKEIENYRNSEALSQSDLKYILSNTNYTKQRKESKAMMVGSLVDMIITMPTEVDNIYYYSDISYPEDKYKLVIDKVFEIYDNPDIDDTQQWLPIFRDLNKLNWKDETVIQNMKDKGLAYWNLKKEIGSKIIVSKEYHHQCNDVACSLISNNVTKHEFNENCIYQKPLYWQMEVDGYIVNCKALPDIIEITQNTVQLKDIKTTTEPLSVWEDSNAKRYNVPFQMAYYMEAISHLYPDKKQLLPKIIVENMNYVGKPRIYQLTEQDIHVGKWGSFIKQEIFSTKPFESHTKIKHSWGFMEGLHRYIQADVLGLADYDIEYYANKGIYQFKGN